MIGNLVARLIAAGTPPELAAEAVAAAFQAGAECVNSTRIPPDTAAEKRRAWDREYRRRNKPIHPIPPEIPPDSTFALSSSLKKERKKANATLCPPEFSPSESHYEAGAKIHLDRSQVESLCDDMKAWSQTNAHRPVAKKCDWGMAFHQWIKRHAGPAAKPNGKNWSGIEGVT
jgi:hypothetical protein